MAACGSCGAGNPDGYRFCGQCGSSLAVRICASCGHPNTAGQAFCGQCGSSLEPIAGATDGPPAEGGEGSSREPVPAAAGEDRGSAQWASGTFNGEHTFVSEADPAGLEERKLATVLFADVVGFTSLAERTDPEVVARMVDVAFRRLSEVVIEHGGTVDKYMGDSVMAVFGVPFAHDDDAERAVAAGLAMRELGGDLAFSIGINSGEVMAASVGRAGDFTVIGDTVNVAARLEEVASAGEVLCGRLTVDLARRGAKFRQRRAVPLKGKREPVEVWEALTVGHLDGATNADPERIGGPPLIGRTDELAFLESQWRRVCRDRRAQVVLLCGEAGSGKTRLLRELMRIADREGTVIRAAYPAYGAMGGPRVAAEIVRQLGPAGDAQVDARVRSTGGEVDPSLLAVDPSAMKQEQIWAFRRLLQEKSSDGPLLVAIDDMHRSGDQTLELLSELSARVGDVPLLTVLVGRTEPADWLTRFPAATRVPLGTLSRQDTGDLARAFVGEKPIDPGTIEFLVDKANGNPLYLRELLVMARDSGLFVDDGGFIRLRIQQDDPLSVPATLQALLAARLDALDPGQKMVLQHVAVIGEPATSEQVVSLGAHDAESALRSLVDAGLLRQSNEGRYDAVDPMLREVAYETLPRNVRGELHRRAANTSALTEEKARHLDRAAGYLPDDASASEDAAIALADAGEAMVSASRLLDGIRLLERALDRGCTRTRTLLVLARTQSMCGRGDDAIETLALIEDDPDDPSVAAERDHTAAGTKIFTDAEWALPRLQQAADRWLALGNAEKHAWARANAGCAHFYLSHMEEAASELEFALEQFEQLGDQNGVVATTAFLCLARPADKRVPGWLSSALEYAEKIGDRSREMTVLTSLTWHQFFRSFCGGAQHVAEASNTARRMAVLAEELGANDLALHGWSLLAIMQRMAGEFDQAFAATTALERVIKGMKPNDRWLAWAATFSVTMARGEWGVSPPFPPEQSADPVAAMATLVVRTELTIAGRIAEAVSGFEGSAPPTLGPIGDLGGVFAAIALVLADRGSDALPWIDRTARAARALDAYQALVAADALRAEVTGDLAGLAPKPTNAKSLSDLLLLRVYALGGDAEAADTLHKGVVHLAMPGLAINI